MDKKRIKIMFSDGRSEEAELVTYLFSDDEQTNYVVYSKGEKNGAEGDEVIYISRIVNNGSSLLIEEINSLQFHFLWHRQSFHQLKFAE